VQKKKKRGKSIYLFLILTLLLTATICFSQQVESKITTTPDLKHFWKQNEILVGLGSALLFTIIVYAVWRKKKRNFSNIDSIS
jgi:hypothetical protein